MSRFLKVAVPAPLWQVFDYLPPRDGFAGDWTPGLRVLVPFGRRSSVGYLLGVCDESAVAGSRIKPVIAVIDERPLLSEADCAVLQWASRYYHHPPGEVFAAAFPVLLRQGREAQAPTERWLSLTEAGRSVPPAALKRAPRQDFLLDWLRREDVAVDALNALEWDWRRPAQLLVDKGWALFSERSPAAMAAGSEPRSPSPELNAAQRSAVAAVDAKLGHFNVTLLEGVTGSGKTEVYLHLVARVLARGEQTLVLLPEISLTPQLEARFRARFDTQIVVFHSGLTEAERCRAWLAVQRGDAAILLGTRSAVFTPMKRPGLIILDEEHDASFKQQDGFRFSARDVAVMRARTLNVPVLLGSATPSLETLLNAQRGRYEHLRLPQRAGASAPPSYRLIDIRAQRLQEGLSEPLIALMRAAVQRGEQSLLFLNRRGFAPTLICHGCGWVAACRRCDARLVLHARDNRLRCHHCGHEQVKPSVCPECGTDDLRPLGLGTERVERALAKLFPDAGIVRIDRDSTRRKGSLERMLDGVHSGAVDILLGTQMLAKGHHFPNVTLVGILDVDAGLYSTDFRAGERSAQQIVQVAGRAGRESRPGVVALQTRHPDHPLLRQLILGGYGEFAGAALAERRDAGLPPYTHQALWRAEAVDSAMPQALLSRIGELSASSGTVGVFGPAPAPMLRQAGRHRYQLLMQSAERAALHRLVDKALQQLPGWPETKRVRWSLDIDPVDLY